MSTFKEQALMGFDLPQGPHEALTLVVTDTTFTVTTGEGFSQWVNDDRLSTDGKSIGELNINYLHKRLDEFCGVKRSLVGLSLTELGHVFEAYNHQNYASSSKEELIDFAHYVMGDLIKKNGG